MKITKLGVLPPPKYVEIWIGKCDFCGCEVEVEQEEAMKESDNKSMWVYCPTPKCPNRIKIKYKIVEMEEHKNTKYICNGSSEIVKRFGLDMNR